MRILLTGKNGQLGWELHRQLERCHDVIALGREDIDFLDSRFLFQMLKRLPELDLIVNAAAYTDVDKAEHELFVAESINSEAAAILAAEADRRGIPMIHFSTDYVFSGGSAIQAYGAAAPNGAIASVGRLPYEQMTPYTESDKPNPICYYGWTKHEGELRIRRILERNLIFRLSGLYGIRRKNFFTTMIRCNRNGVIPEVVNDQIVTPNWTPLVAEAVAHVIQRLSQGEVSRWGTYHLSGGGFTTWYEFAELIFSKLNELWGVNMPGPTSITSKEYGATANRPKYSVLDSTRFNKTFQYSLPDWKEQFLLFLGGLQPETHKHREKISCSTF